MRDFPGQDRRAANGGERGFTLIETSIAMVVMMVVGLATASLFTWAVTYNSSAASRELATQLAQQRVERLRTIPFDADTRNLAYAAGGLGATAAAGVVENNVMSGGRPFNVTTLIENIATDPTGAPTLKRITITVMPTGAGPTLGGVRLVTLRTTTHKGTF
jgi:type II secretory pathway pseudopilin PulG